MGQKTETPTTPADVQPGDDDLLTTGQVAEYLEIHQKTLYRQHIGRSDFPEPAKVNPLARRAGVFYRRGDVRRYRDKRIAELETARKGEGR